MTINVTGFLHAGVRIGPTEDDAKKAKNFYEGLLGLHTDGNRPYIEGIPGFWSNIRGEGDRSQQVHIMGAEGASPVARSAKEDPTLVGSRPGSRAPGTDRQRRRVVGVQGSGRQRFGPGVLRRPVRQHDRVAARQGRTF